MAEHSTSPSADGPGRGANDASVRAAAARGVAGRSYPQGLGATLRQKERAENFPVALSVLPGRFRGHLRALYDVARVIDDLGDLAAGDRTGQLNEFRADLALIWRGRRPASPVLRRLAGSVRACDLEQEPFDRLVAANLQDQEVTRYATYEDLRRYCTLSADPVGRVVLKIFGASTPQRVELSDRICTALQLIEHWQDIAEDRRAGRIYLPMEDMAAHGVAEEDLDRPKATPALRRLVAFETSRASRLLDSGSPLVGTLRGWARLAVAGYVAGGRATIAAIRRAGYDVLPATPRPRRRDVIVELARMLLRPPRAGAPGESPDAIFRPRAQTLEATRGETRKVPLAEAYARCRMITKDQARNFYYGIRLLPPPKRDALCAVYALARRVDDIGDGDLAVGEKAAALAGLRQSLKTIDESADPVLVGVADAAHRYPIPLDAFAELVDGVEMDVVGRTYGTFEELVDYCRCVAGSIGRLCLGVFGSRPHPEASRYADSLGIALQQTNILRDIREDLASGRIYLPKEDLDTFGVELTLDERGVLVDRDGSLRALIEFSARRAERWYAEGMRLAPLLDRRSRACCTAMAGIYRKLLRQIADDPALVFDRRLSLAGRQKLVVAARALAGAGQPSGVQERGRPPRSLTS